MLFLPRWWVMHVRYTRHIDMLLAWVIFPAGRETRKIMGIPRSNPTR